LGISGPLLSTARANNNKFTTITKTENKSTYIQPEDYQLKYTEQKTNMHCHEFQMWNFLPLRENCNLSLTQYIIKLIVK